MFTSVIHTPIGTMTICSDGEAVTRLCFGMYKGDMGSHLPVHQACERQLSEYFSGRRKQFDLPLAPEGTAFQQLVWKALQEIPYGETRSYREIAAAVGNPRAARAVGLANNRNPIPILIPCHRVIGADGSLVGYAGGIPAKDTLLQLEAMYR